MGFIRRFGEENIKKLIEGENGKLFLRLKEDVLAGAVFPAVRKDGICFYYKGGLLYRFSGGSFKRDPAYESYGKNLREPDPYKRAKKQNEIKFTGVSGAAKERMLLDGLYGNTFRAGKKPRAAVLDIEVNLNGVTCKGKKCDLVLYNTSSRELAFAEGKVFSDSRVLVSLGCKPEVIGQVNAYSAALSEQRENVLRQYAEHIRVVNALFGSDFDLPVKLLEPVKLLVYETDLRSGNARYSVETVERELGEDNVLWLKRGENYPTEEIWDRLICR